MKVSTTIKSSVIADGSCMSPKRFLGGECKHYEGCRYRREAECKGTSAAQAKIERQLVKLGRRREKLERQLARLKEEEG